MYLKIEAELLIALKRQAYENMKNDIRTIKRIQRESSFEK